MTELKPCPFCGGNAKISYCDMRLVGVNDFGNKRVRIGVKAICNRCKARGPLFTGNVVDPWTKEGKETEAYKFLVQQAEDTWNRRADNG